MKGLSKSDSMPSKRKLVKLAAETRASNKNLVDARKRKKSEAPASKQIHLQSTSKKGLSKSDSKGSNRKLVNVAAETSVGKENILDARKRKKSKGVSIKPIKGTMKRKRWLLNKLSEKSEGYEDDLFESQDFNFKPAFHFGDESDISINIATPKFDRILTPALPKRTPRFKDCISPTELSQARKSAEEYQYRRNKKKRSTEEPSSSCKKTNMEGNKTSCRSPEKKKLDFEEAVNELIEVQKNLELEAEVDNEREDSYFSDA